MSFFTRFTNIFFSGRLDKIERFRKSPAAVQQEQFHRLVSIGADTEYGKLYEFGAIVSPEQFRRQVPLTDYEGLKAYINRARAGEESVLWPGKTKWFAKSSGTTSDSSKYIPVTDDGLADSHLRGPKDIFGIVADLYPGTGAYDGKFLTLGGSHKLDPLGTHAHSGDLSSILIENTPVWARQRRIPRADTALIPDFEEKIIKICEETAGKNVTAFAGVPSWNLVMIRKILDLTGRSDLTEVWPKLELFVHGGMSFEPYREQFRKVIPSDKMKYLETYNASEGFFGIQDDPSANDMLLMLDYGIFYEFLPVQHLSDPSKAVPLEDVRPDVNYAMIITTSNGLWRYMIGDTVTFTSVAPYKIRITGRTKLFLNVFGEEVIIDNAERAVKAACEATRAAVSDYTAGPVFMRENAKGGHEWVIEFTKKPDDAEKFARVLDLTLQELNSDYQAKRHKDTTLYPPVVRIAPQGTFYRWMDRRGRLGGQNKVPRLSNQRRYVEELTAIAGEIEESARRRQPSLIYI